MALKKQLKRLNNRQIAKDIKQYIRSSHNFYNDKVPEMKTLAKKLYEEQNLKEFYKIFNRLWNSSSLGENSLAIHSLRLYKEEFNLETWRFLKPKLKNIKSWDQVDYIGEFILGEIVLKYNSLEKEIIKLTKSKNIWLKRLSILSTWPLIDKKDYKLAIKVVEINLYDKHLKIQKAVGKTLRKISGKRLELVKRFILKNINMPSVTFGYATENLKELRKIRRLKRLRTQKRRFFFWR